MTGSAIAHARKVAFQGEPGAYSHLACANVLPDMTPLPSATFEDAFQAVETGAAALAMIPIENSLAGRVADIHHLMPQSKLFIVGEHFQRVNHHLLALPGVVLEDLKVVRSHVHALGQCRGFIRRHGLRAEVAADTAGSARELAAGGARTSAAIASSLAGDIYGLQSLAADIEDADHNTTRFVILRREALASPAPSGPVVTSFIFEVKNVPAALYKALGGFATNGVNMVRLESYQTGGTFEATRFYADILGHPEDEAVARAMAELAFHTRAIKMLGTYPQHPFRLKHAQAASK
jgi:prephenate dehydratase